MVSKKKSDKKVSQKKGMKNPDSQNDIIKFMSSMPKYQHIIIILIFVTSFLLIPQLMRTEESGWTLAGHEPYLHMRLAKVMHEKGLYGSILSLDDKVEDEMIYGGREVKLNPTDLILAGVYGVFDNPRFMFIIPLIFAIVMSVLVYFLLQKLGLGSGTSFFSTLIIVSSPPFIHAFSGLGKVYPAIFMTVCMVLMLRKGEGIWHLLSLALLLLMGLYGLTFFVIGVMVFLATYSYFNKTPMPIFAMLLFLVLVTVYSFSPYATAISTGTFEDRLTQVFQSMISDMGGLTGFGIFNFFLFVVGISSIWKRKRQLASIFVLVGSLLLLAIFVDPSINAFTLLFLSPFMALGFFRILDMRWEFEIVKELTLLIIVCGILFSALSFMTRIDTMEPENHIINGLNHLATLPDGLVLSSADRAYWLQEIAGKPTISDPLYHSQNADHIRISDLETMLHSRNLEITRDLLDKYGVKYIWIDQHMKLDVWKKDKDGILFLFRNSQNFKKIYDSGEVFIWEVLPKSIEQ